MARHVVVIGAGAVGAASALAALKEGHRVTILDPAEPGGEQAASYGNGCWLSPMSVIPPAVPGIWKKLPKFLADPLFGFRLAVGGCGAHRPCAAPLGAGCAAPA
jgi:D-amino-acid dehydrogenase